MAITYITRGSFFSSTTSPMTVTAPAGGLVQGRLQMLVVVNKYPPNGPLTPSGVETPWVLIGQATGGAGASGLRSGNVYTTVYARTFFSSSPGVSNTDVYCPSLNEMCACIFAWDKDHGLEWDLAAAVGSDNTAGTGWSITTDTGLDVRSGDTVVVCNGTNGNGPLFSGDAITQSGITFGATTQRGFGGPSTPDVTSIVVSDAIATAGISSSAVMFAMTASSATAVSPAGASVVVRLREKAVGGTSGRSGGFGGARGGFRYRTVR